MGDVIYPRFSFQVQGKGTRNPIPEKRQVTRVCTQPNSTLWVCRDCIAPRNFSLGERLAHLEIVDADESSWRAFAFRPNIAVDIFCKTEYQAQRLMIGFRDTPEAAIFVDEERVVNANPDVAIMV